MHSKDTKRDFYDAFKNQISISIKLRQLLIQKNPDLTSLASKIKNAFLSILSVHTNNYSLVFLYTQSKNSLTIFTQSLITLIALQQLFVVVASVVFNKETFREIATFYSTTNPVQNGKPVSMLLISSKKLKFCLMFLLLIGDSKQNIN